MKKRVHCGLRRGRRHQSHRDALYDDLNPRSEHAEAMDRWQSRALRLMWEAAFGLALWHSGDSEGWMPIDRHRGAAAFHSVDLNQ
jgi:hypothetical protein